MTTEIEFGSDYVYIENDNLESSIDFDFNIDGDPGDPCCNITTWLKDEVGNFVLDRCDVQQIMNKMEVALNLK